MEERTEECGREDCGVWKRRLRSLEERTEECGRKDSGVWKTGLRSVEERIEECGRVESREWNRGLRSVDSRNQENSILKQFLDPPIRRFNRSSDTDSDMLHHTCKVLIS